MCLKKDDKIGMMMERGVILWDIVTMSVWTPETVVGFV